MSKQARILEEDTKTNRFGFRTFEPSDCLGFPSSLAPLGGAGRPRPMAFRAEGGRYCDFVFHRGPGGEPWKRVIPCLTMTESNWVTTRPRDDVAKSISAHHG